MLYCPVLDMIFFAENVCLMNTNGRNETNNFFALSYCDKNAGHCNSYEHAHGIA